MKQTLRFIDYSGFDPDHQWANGVPNYADSIVARCSSLLREWRKDLTSLGWKNEDVDVLLGRLAEARARVALVKQTVADDDNPPTTALKHDVKGAVLKPLVTLRDHFGDWLVWWFDMVVVESGGELDYSRLDGIFTQVSGALVLLNMNIAVLEQLGESPEGDATDYSWTHSSGPGAVLKIPASETAGEGPSPTDPKHA